ncbi:MAG TPA: Wzz/FepE/Etk N-terminal domain-containing protein, partial [Acetobacteraceae bacterium]|nr:Wzz/FepE/Etk N-terminal domain-containing protein [Acetobacteraceae bacterium]
MDEVLALLRRMSAGVWRRRWLAVGVSWLVCIAGWVVVLALPARYEASTQIYVAADPVLKPLLNGIAINGTSDAEFALLRQTLLSRPNLTALIQKTGLDNQAQGPGAQEALIRSLADRIQIIPQTDQLFTISYQSKNPKKAFTIVQNLEDIYVERSADRNQSDIDNATVFLDSQIAYFKQQLQQVEQTRAAFQAKYLQLLPGANGVSELGTEAALVTNLQGQLQDALAQKQMIQAALAKTSPVLTAAQGGAVLDGLRRGLCQQIR